MEESMSRRALFVTAMTGAFVLATAPGAMAADPAPETDVSFELRVGALAGLTGDLAVSGQPWSEATRIAVEDIQSTLGEMGLDDQIQITFVGAEDSQGNQSGGIEAATKLAQADQADVVVGDFFSSVSIAAAQSVFIPNEVLQFTGGTNAAISTLEDNNLVWRPVASDALQGQLVASLLADRFGADATINVGYRNDAYGAGLAEVFREAWTVGGGTVGAEVAFDEGAATLDTEAQSLVAGNPDGWFVVAFCGDWGKLKGPLQRTGAWDPTRTHSADALSNCEGPDALVEGMTGTEGTSTAGSSFPAYQALYEEEASSGTEFQQFTTQAFDSVYLAFLGALAAGSSEPTEIAAQLQGVSGPPGEQYTFEQLQEAITAILSGEEIDFEGSTGPIDFDEVGDITVNIYRLWQVNADGEQATQEEIFFTPE
jgi:ABC-type branched-subunit amino acid transport system substrate-binding protein